MRGDSVIPHIEELDNFLDHLNPDKRETTEGQHHSFDHLCLCGWSSAC